MDPPRPSTAIRRATEDCRRGLEECVLLPRLMNNEWAENRTVDFNLWIAGIGALAGRNASLDARLGSQPETSLMVLNLLILFKIFLERCRALASQEVEEPGILHRPPINQESGPMSFSRRSSLSSQGSHESPLTPLSQISSSQSADIGESEEPSDSGSSNASEMGDLKPSSALAQARRNVETTLDNLTMVAFAIRRSGTSSRLLKADATFNPDSEEFLRLRNQLTFVLLAENRDPIATKELAEKTANGPAVFSTDASAMSVVQQRLVEACLRRFNRFRYAQTHATKLGTVRDVQLPEPKPKSWLPDQSPLPKDQPPGPAPVRPPSPQRPRASPAARRGGVVSETMASEVASALHRKLVDNSTPSQQSNTEISTNASRLQYPGPPKVHDDQQNFRCPCCCQTLPRIVLGRHKWRKHISEDLSPYTCIFDGCSKPDVLYVTQDAWLNHIQKEHSTTIWNCVMCDTSESFSNSESFTEHIKSEHHETVLSDEIATILSMCSITSQGTISLCPLCRWTDAEHGKTAEPNSLLEHIAEHIHSFSLRSLPWPPLSGERNRKAIKDLGSELHIKTWLDMQLSQPPSDEPGEEHTAITGTVVRKHLEKASAFFASSAQDVCTDIDEKPIHEDYFYDNAYFGDSTQCSSVAENPTDLDDSSCITYDMPKVHGVSTEGPETISQEDRADPGSSFPSKSKIVDRSTDWSEWIWDAHNSQHYRTKLVAGEYIYDYRLSEVQPSRETPRSQHFSNSHGVLTEGSKSLSPEDRVDDGSYFASKSQAVSSRSKAVSSKSKAISFRSKAVDRSTDWSEWIWDAPNSQHYRTKLGPDGQYIYDYQQSEVLPSRETPRSQPLNSDVSAYNESSEYGYNDFSNDSANTSISCWPVKVSTRSNHRVQDQGQSAYGTGAIAQTMGFNYYDYTTTAREDFANPATNTGTHEVLVAGYQPTDARGANESEANARNIQGTMGQEERLDPRFKLHNARYFKPGQVFKVLWSEPRGEIVHSSIRCFVIVAADYGHCQCLPILTYQHQGTSKYEVQREHYAIIYTGNEPPQEIQGEARLERKPIRVIPKTTRDNLETDSRINYAKIYTVEHNLKVKFVGWIADESKTTLFTDFDAVWAAKKKIIAQQEYP